MKILGVDPSLTNLGYVVLEDGKILERGRFQTETSDGLNLQRYVLQASSVAKLVRKYDIKYLATEAPFFSAFSTELLFALQSILHLTYWSLGLRVVLLAPLTVKSYACPKLNPKDVLKKDMVDSAKLDLKMGERERLANDVADAYWIAKLGSRWWSYYNKNVTAEELTTRESEIFLAEHTYTKGKKKGVTERKGIVHRKNELYYLYDELPAPAITFAHEGKQDELQTTKTLGGDQRSTEETGGQGHVS